MYEEWQERSAEQQRPWRLPNMAPGPFGLIGWGLGGRGCLYPGCNLRPHPILPFAAVLVPLEVPGLDTAVAMLGATSEGAEHSRDALRSAGQLEGVHQLVRVDPLAGT